MDYGDDEDPWAKRTPVDEQKDALSQSPDSIPAALPASTSTGSIVVKDSNNDYDNEGAWNADSDEEAGNDESFVEATSRMSLSASFVAEEQDEQSHDDNGFESTQPIAGPSTFTNAFVDTIASSGPPLDDFDEDEDDFGDFGEPASGNTANDDDDDFGAFDEAGVSEDPSFGLEDNNQQPEAGPSRSSTSVPAPPPPDNDESDWGPPSTIDFESIWQDKEALTSAIIGHFEKAYPSLYAGLDESPARREAWNKIDMSLEPEQIMLRNNPGAKRILEDYTDATKFPYKPWEWKRSHIRIQAMREQGIPVNLDDVRRCVPSARRERQNTDGFFL